MGQKRINEVELKSGFLFFHSPHWTEKPLPSSPCRKTKASGTYLFCASIIVITWAATSIVEESFSSVTLPVCPAWKEYTFWHLSLCILTHGNLAASSFSCLTGIEIQKQESKWESAQGASQHNSVCLLNYCCHKLMNISPPAFSYKDRKLSWFNRIFHMPIVMGTGYTSQKWEIFSLFEAAA